MKNELNRFGRRRLESVSKRKKKVQSKPSRRKVKLPKHFWQKGKSKFFFARMDQEKMPIEQGNNISMLYKKVSSV